MDLLTPNELEAAALTGVEIGSLEGAREAGKRLLELGAARVIVTLGGEGALLCEGSGATHYPAFPVQAVDTVAAGDAFNGALAAALAGGASLEEVVPLANAAAALACTRRGAQPSLPHRAEVEAFLGELGRRA